jgi:hypothetical protein
MLASRFVHLRGASSQTQKGVLTSVTVFGRHFEGILSRNTSKSKVVKMTRRSRRRVVVVVVASVGDRTMV